MKRIAKFGALALWLLFATFESAYWWGRHPQAVPSPPDAFWIWLDNLANAHCCEAMADVEIFYMLTVSFLFVCLCTFIAWRVFKRLRAR
jgi:hypothetical protein